MAAFTTRNKRALSSSEDDKENPKRPRIEDDGSKTSHIVHGTTATSHSTTHVLAPLAQTPNDVYPPSSRQPGHPDFIDPRGRFWIDQRLQEPNTFRLKYDLQENDAPGTQFFHPRPHRVLSLPFLNLENTTGLPDYNVDFDHIEYYDRAANGLMGPWPPFPPRDNRPFRYRPSKAPKFFSIPQLPTDGCDSFWERSITPFMASELPDPYSFTSELAPLPPLPPTPQLPSLSPELQLYMGQHQVGPLRANPAAIEDEDSDVNSSSDGSDLFDRDIDEGEYLSRVYENEDDSDDEQAEKQEPEMEAVFGHLQEYSTSRVYDDDDGVPILQGRNLVSDWTPARKEEDEKHENAVDHADYELSDDSEEETEEHPGSGTDEEVDGQSEGEADDESSDTEAHAENDDGSNFSDEELEEEDSEEDEDEDVDMDDEW